ncbi:Hypothetical protein GSB_152035 [Giardia duodenalis]|uniref:Uncharacterized protein n=2 Tax=Giardia intestinalis TaxID=5741 RepID=V6TYB0_GIAIN|nr:Hypothetical protein GSB_152035 [Giardia intestinalis]
MTIIRKNNIRPEAYSLAACVSGQRIRKPENPALEQAARKRLEERIKHRARRMQDETRSKDAIRATNRVNPRMPGLDKLITSPPTVSRSPSVYGIFTGGLANVHNHATPPSTLKLQQLYCSVPLSEIVLASPDSTSDDAQKQYLIGPNQVCQPDTYSQSPISLSLGDFMSPTDISISSPVYIAKTQSYNARPISTLTAPVTPELLHTDCCSSYLSPRDLNSLSDSYLTNSTVFLSTIYEESDGLSDEYSDHSCTPRIATLCTIEQDQWHAVRALSPNPTQCIDL